MTNPTYGKSSTCGLLIGCTIQVAEDKGAISQGVVLDLMRDYKKCVKEAKKDGKHNLNL